MPMQKKLLPAQSPMCPQPRRGGLYRAGRIEQDELLGLLAVEAASPQPTKKAPQVWVALRGEGGKIVSIYIYANTKPAVLILSQTF
ncbi:MAG TPA: hypothetical protein VGG19_20255 [Tepidisphaeraceae bacterium]|jgi:hypothetical protein